MAELELLFDPLFSKRKLTERHRGFLRALCAELGLIEQWQSRLAGGHSAVAKSAADGNHRGFPDHAKMRHWLRAKSIRNLGTLRHRPSWPLLVDMLDDRHPDIQSVAVRSLAAIGAPESFPLLRERLHAVAQGKSSSPPLQVLQAAMVSFGLDCLPDLLPSLCHPDRQVRLRATEILGTMVCRVFALQPNPTLSTQLLTPQMVELLLTRLSVDTSAEIRARAAEVIVFLADARVTPVLRDLLCDNQWYVRLRTLQALTQLSRTAAPLHLDIRECLVDPHWGVREAAVRTLISLGRTGKNQLYEHFLTSRNRTTCEQIVEVLERTGLISVLVEEYSAGTKGVDALMVERLASEAAPLGLSGILRTLNPEIRQRFLDRFLPYAEARLRFQGEVQPEMESPIGPQQVLDFPTYLAA